MVLAIQCSSTFLLLPPPPLRPRFRNIPVWNSHSRVMYHLVYAQVGRLWRRLGGRLVTIGDQHLTLGDVQGPWGSLELLAREIDRQRAGRTL
jgi:hypothetical protein